MSFPWYFAIVIFLFQLLLLLIYRAKIYPLRILVDQIILIRDYFFIPSNIKKYYFLIFNDYILIGIFAILGFLFQLFFITDGSVDTPSYHKELFSAAISQYSSNDADDWDTLNYSSDTSDYSSLKSISDSSDYSSLKSISDTSDYFSIIDNPYPFIQATNGLNVGLNKGSNMIKFDGIQNFIQSDGIQNLTQSDAIQNFVQSDAIQSLIQSFF